MRQLAHDLDLILNNFKTARLVTSAGTLWLNPLNHQVVRHIYGDYSSPCDQTIFPHDTPSQILPLQFGFLPHTREGLSVAETGQKALA